MKLSAGAEGGFHSPQKDSLKINKGGVQKAACGAAKKANRSIKILSVQIVVRRFK